ncbi:cation:proton antiporter [Methanomassiliicoccus luminyensis]|uniref:cation:proton antiporter n=1 Tax=Methanomassiliicoccus luminyensis TaxID=1080712 RepID=UPI00036EAEEC|nr:cation:proton antiporter [Methanomassiliicoccus luminyensis]
MSEVRVIIDMAILLIISGIFAVIFAKIKMPPILGYICAGIIIGPTMFPDLWVEGETVSILSSLGIVLLLFYIGLETDLSKLKSTGMKILIIVLVQMPFMVAIGYVLGILLGMNFVQSIFLGAIISGTSTAVVTGILKTAKHIDAEMAKLIITITIFEDVGQVLILTMAAPLLAGDTPALGSTLYMVMGLILFVGMTVVFGMTLVPRLINFVGKRFSPEILLIVAVGLCFLMAAISSVIGLDFAIGAFFMGVMIAMSRFGHKIMKTVEPVKELFMAVFFVSIGLQVSPVLIYENIWLAVIIAVVFIVSKIVSIFIGCYLVNMSARDSLTVATSLLAMGEFAFIIAAAALGAGVVSQGFYAAVIGGALISMFVMPLITKIQPKLFDWTVKLIPNRLLCSLRSIDDIRSTASSGWSKGSPSSAKIKNSIFLIVVDAVVLIAVMLFFNLAEEQTQQLQSVMMQWNLPGDVLLLALLIIVIAPVVVNMFTNAKKIAEHLTTMVMESPRNRANNPNIIYRVFVNLIYAAMVMVVLLLIIPLMPNLLLIGPLGLAVALICGAVILMLAWDTLRRVYARFCAMVTNRPDNGEEHE